jgi:hypothetical protein
MRTYPLIEFKFTDGTQIQRDIPVAMRSTSFEIQSEFQKDDLQLFYCTLTFDLAGFIYTSYWNSTLGTVVGNKGLSGDVKYIEQIDIDFENIYGTIFESMSIYEGYPTGVGTGTDPIIFKEITGHV